jgi:hypothetical protein
MSPHEVIFIEACKINGGTWVQFVTKGDNPKGLYELKKRFKIFRYS